MGNLYSSLPVVAPKKYEEVEEEDCSSNPSTPLPASTTVGKLRPLTALIDPRSPTVGVSRTPVEVVAEREKMRQEMFRKLQLQALEVPGGGVQIAVKTPESLQVPAAWDPRSPTQDYNRTPLALGDKRANSLMGSQDEAKSESGMGNLIEDVDASGKKVPETEIQATEGGGKMCRDLRKRLFVEKLNESLAASDDNKEN